MAPAAAGAGADEGERGRGTNFLRAKFALVRVQVRAEGCSEEECDCGSFCAPRLHEAIDEAVLRLSRKLQAMAAQGKTKPTAGLPTKPTGLN